MAKKIVFVKENKNKEYKCKHCGGMSVEKKGVCSKCGKEK